MLPTEGKISNDLKPSRIKDTDLERREETHLSFRTRESELTPPHSDAVTVGKRHENSTPLTHQPSPLHN